MKKSKSQRTIPNIKPTTTTTQKPEKPRQGHAGKERKTHQLDLRRRQLERHGAQVIAEPLLLARRRDGHDVLVDAPAQADLAGVDGVFLRQLREDVVHGAAGGFGHGGLWAVGREGDVLYVCVCVSCCAVLCCGRVVELGRFLGGELRTYVFLVVVDQACVLEVRVEFDLVDGGRRGGRLEEPVEVLGEVV